MLWPALALHEPLRASFALLESARNGISPRKVSAKLKEPTTKDRKFEDVVKDAEQAAVLVLVY